ncbi:hypothetical protein UFOVP724_151 [uncultured Caudovirales phage]|uniref:Uncharacterized protein n=1 Tax=uncultured Caudovirales phage TaxID=2100421 RepID=A0A6J5NKE4_9CAUD|nr:hypothetical protein UFOVP724_151 [uncultured Caudovirales phage]
MSNNSLLNNALQIPLFVDGERPSASKFNALFQHLNLKIAMLSTALGDPIGTGNIKYKGIYGNIFTVFGSREIVDLNSASISDSIGPQSFLNPMSYVNLDQDLKNVTLELPVETTEYCFENKVHSTSDFVFSSSIPLTKVNSLNELKDFAFNTIPYFFNHNNNTIYFKNKLSLSITVNYKTADWTKFSHFNSGFNVVPDPNVFLINNLDDEFKLRITELPITGQYSILLPKIKALPINATNTGIGTETDSTNPLNEYQIHIPRHIYDTYYNTNLNIPSNVITLKCLDTGEVFNKANYIIQSKTQIKVENLALDPDCLITMNFVLLFAGANNLTNSVADLNVKMGRHVHDGSYGEERVDIKDITGIFNKQDDIYKYYPSLNIALNHMPQYLHRNGWSLDCDTLNNDNTMQGDLVVEKKVIFTKPTEVNSDNPNKPFMQFANNFLDLKGGVGTEIFRISNFFIIQFFSSILQINSTVSSSITSPIVNLNTNNLNYDTTNNSNLIERYTDGVQETVVAKEARTIVNPDIVFQLSDTAQIAKEEFVEYSDSNKTVLSKFNSFYRNNSYPSNTANLLIESKNNLPPNIVNDKKRSGKLQAETTKTIYLNCIPTFAEQTIPSADSATLPKFLIPQGELTESTLFDADEIDESETTNNGAGYKLYNLRSETLNSIIQYGNKLRDKIKTIPGEVNNGYGYIITLGNVKFALIKREKFLSDFASQGYLNSDENLDGTKKTYKFNHGVNESLSILDSTNLGSRDHIMKYFYNGNPDRKRYEYDINTGNKEDALEYTSRPDLDKYDSFYEADLIYVPIRQNAQNKDYDQLTLDDLDSSIEFRYLELKELNTLNHPFSLSSGNAGYPLISYSSIANHDKEFPSFLTKISSIIRPTSTSWFKESFPLIRITNRKTNIVNIDHAHNVDVLNRIYNRFSPRDGNALLYNKTYGLNKFIRNQYGHLLYRTQILTAMVDIDHEYLTHDNEYVYDINIQSKILPIHYKDDPDGTYDAGYYEEQPTITLNTDTGSSLSLSNDYNRVFSTFNGLSYHAYEFFYDLKGQSSTTNRNEQLRMDALSTNNDSYERLHLNRVVYEGPAVKLIVKGVDHYVVKAKPMAMYPDSQGNLFNPAADDSATQIGDLGLKTYRLGFKDTTNILRDSQNDTKEYNGIFFYNYSSSGFFFNRAIPTNTVTSNLAVMTNSDLLADLQFTTESQINTGNDNNEALKAKRRIPSYASLNNSQDINTHTSHSWDDIVITNTSDLQIKVTVKEELVPIYQPLSTQIGNVDQNKIYNPYATNADGNQTDEIRDAYLDDLNNSSKNPSSVNLSPQGYKLVKVAYIETNNELLYKETDHRYRSSSEFNEYVPDSQNVAWQYREYLPHRHLFKDNRGQNKFGMMNSYIPQDTTEWTERKASYIGAQPWLLRRSKL